MTETRNIIDYYHYWDNEAIKADLDDKRHNFSILCCNVVGDFNLSTIIRNSNAFLAKEVIIYGKKRYDRRGAVGTQNYTNFKYVKIIEDLKEVLHDEKYHVVGIDNIGDCKNIEKYTWPKDKHVLMIFGEEQIGIPKDVLSLCDDILYINQYGSVRSLNVGSASAIAMFSYCSQI